MSSVVVIQARTTSSRLPAKAFLPINGLPTVILAAKRSTNTGRKVIVATSIDSSDDGLADLLSSNAVDVYRGSLDSPLNRIVSCLSTYPDDTIVHRLTADNVFPDGAFLDELEKYFKANGLSYLCCNGERSGIPYGMSAELMWLKDLRAAHDETDDPFDHEHVTPAIRKRFGEHYFTGYESLTLGSLRCTIDSLDDYLSILKIFSGVEDPVNVPWVDLCARLKSQAPAPQSSLSRPINELVLGTAQLGINYGINNPKGQPTFSEAQDIVRAAIQCGVVYLDTARAYGNSEYVIGQAISKGWEGRVKVITKLSPLEGLSKSASTTEIQHTVNASVFESCVNLRTQQIDVLLLHRASHLTAWGGQVWRHISQLHHEQVINSLGVSVQTPDELKVALAEPLVSFIQLPFNILDWRWDSMLKEIETAKSKSVNFHVRSTLLQGLLVTCDPVKWAYAHVDNPQPILDWLANSVEKCGREDIVDLCIAFVRGNSWVDGVCIGMENSEQLATNATLFQRPALTRDQISNLRQSRPGLSASTLNPGEWGENE